jgi:hypothetical protein
MTMMVKAFGAVPCHAKPFMIKSATRGHRSIAQAALFMVATPY